MADKTRSARLETHPRPHLRLLPPFVCRRTVEALEDLAERARRGEITGIAFAVLMLGRTYYVNAVGKFADDPTFARGAVAALDDELSEVVRKRANAAPDAPF